MLIGARLNRACIGIGSERGKKRIEGIYRVRCWVVGRNNDEVLYPIADATLFNDCRICER